MNEWYNNKTKVVLIGRVNVGKSTLFNKMTEKTQALVSRLPGTTRDANQGLVTWRGVPFTLVDTGGWEEKPHDKLSQLITKESMRLAEKADCIVYVGDAREGILPDDRALARAIKQLAKPLCIVVNKMERKHLHADAAWYALGLGDPLPIAAIEGRGVGTLLDRIVEKIPSRKTRMSRPITIGLIGKPNVGKSSIVNAVAGTDSMMVSAEAHTTRESHPVFVHAFGKEWLLVDTAGLRKKSKREGIIEKTGAHFSKQTALVADINWLIIDSKEGVGAQDKKLAQELTDTQRGLIIVGNKWDLVRAKNSSTQTMMARLLKMELKGVDWADIHFVSALTRKGFNALFTATETLCKKQHGTIDEKKLEDWLTQFKKRHPATRPGNPKKRIAFLALKQRGVNPLRFELSVRPKDYLPQALLNRLENQLRDDFRLKGLPIRVGLKRVRV